MKDEMNTELEAPVQQSPDIRIDPDWTESEWFEVWLKLARHEYETAVNQ
jgi:hypothetical protein